MKKCEIQVIIAIIILTRSSETIFNTSRYAGKIWTMETEIIYIEKVGKQIG